MADPVNLLEATAAPAETAGPVNLFQELRNQPPGTKVPGVGLVDDPNRGAGAWTNARASLAPGIEDQIAHFARARGLPVNRYGVVDGHIVYADPQTGQLVRETPSVRGATGVGDALLRSADFAASEAGPTLPGIAGTVTGTLMGPTGASIPAAAATAGATDVGRQALSRWLLGDSLINGDAFKNVDYWNSGGQAALAGIGQAGGVLLSKLSSANPLGVKAWDRMNAEAPATAARTAELEALEKHYDIDLSSGQKTGLRSVQALERQNARYPETMDAVHDFTSNQRFEQVPAAIRKEIGDISPVPPGEEAVNAFRTAGTDIVKAELDKNAQQSARAYAAALDDRAPYVDDTLKGLMQRPAMQDALKQATVAAQNRGLPPSELGITDFNAAGDPVFGAAPSWRAWDYIKRSLDDVIEASKDARTGRLTDAGAAAQGIKRDMLAVLDRVNPDYAAARLLHGSNAEVADEMLKGGFGLLQKLKDAQPLDRVQIVRKVFDADSLTAEEVGRMRTNFALAGKTGEWNAAVADWMSDRLSTAIDKAGLNGNVPAQFLKLVDTEHQRPFLMAALGGDKARVDGIQNLFKILRASAEGLPEGSPTVTDAMMATSDAGRMISQGTRAVGTVLNPKKWLDIPEKLVEWVAEMKAPAKRIELVNMLLHGDTGKQLRSLALLSPGDERARVIASQLLGQVMQADSSLRTPADRPVPDASPAPTR